MRALPIIVDLFVLLTVFALVLFYAALGDTAPNEDSSQLTMMEVSAFLGGGAVGFRNGFDLVSFRAEVVDGEGQQVGEPPVEVPHLDPSKRRFLIRTAPENAEFRLIATNVAPKAFENDYLEIRLERIYPSNTAVQSTKAVGLADILKLAVKP